jgi:metal-responsive CopG/Arc/MetJ family transcriptional regulator
MKTAISIPDDVFEAAEKTAKREGISRSKLYTRAVRHYLRKQGRKSIKEQLNAIYADQVAEIDPVLRHIQYSVLAREKW